MRRKLQDFTRSAVVGQHSIWPVGLVCLLFKGVFWCSLVKSVVYGVSTQDAGWLRQRLHHRHDGAKLWAGASQAWRPGHLWEESGTQNASSCWLMTCVCTPARISAHETGGMWTGGRVSRYSPLQRAQACQSITVYITSARDALAWLAGSGGKGVEQHQIRISP